jgi:hypothetical protein
MSSAVAPPWAQRLPLKWQTSARPLAARRQSYADFGGTGSLRTHGRRQAARVESYNHADQTLKLMNRSRSPNAMLPVEVRARVLRSLIPPPRLKLSEWIESNIILPEGD